MDNNSNNKKTLPKWVKILLIVLGSIAIIAAGVLLYWFSTTAPPAVSTPAPSDQADDGINADSIALYDPNEREAGRYYTILVVGNDPEGQNTDTMMLARYDAKEKSMNVISIPRDTLVNIPTSIKKLNSVFHREDNGGIEGLMDEVEKLTGFRPDSYVVVYPPDFEAAIDILGGVEFDVPVNMHHNGEEINLTAGLQTLTGQQAIGVFRYRDYPNGDIDRLEVQHDLISAIADKAMSLDNLGSLYQIAQRILEHAQTNLTMGNMQWYAAEFLSMDLEDIHFYSVPANIYCNICWGSYVSIYPDQWLETVNEYLNPLTREITLDDCEILYQVAYDGGTYNLDPANYVVTNGNPIAGGLESFYHYPAW